MGAGACLAMSGIDMALWDIRGKALGVPLFTLLGGARMAIPAYAGGVSLGYQPPALLVDEAAKSLGQGYKAVKLRVGDSVPKDIERLHAVRKEFGNTAGENHYTRFEFNRVIEDGAITILQPDLSKSGGITEALRIAALASAWGLPVHPHSSMTGVNHAATIHFLAAIDNGGYFEGDVSKSNKFRDELVENPSAVDRHGNVWPLDKFGIGLEVSEEFLRKHPAIEGPGYL
jgi:L-alanine-DL-glutamate epimerase-like enolase superfamily enzyme